MNALYRHLRLLLTISLLVGGQAEFQGEMHGLCEASQSQGRARRNTVLRRDFWHPMESIYTPDVEHAAGKLRAPETLYDTVTKNVVSKVDTVLPVSKAEFQAYKNETTAVINALVGKLNSLTPVSSLILLCTA